MKKRISLKLVLYIRTILKYYKNFLQLLLVQINIIYFYFLNKEAFKRLIEEIVCIDTFRKLMIILFRESKSISIIDLLGFN